VAEVAEAVNTRRRAASALSGRKCFSLTVRTHRFLQWHEGWGAHHQTVQRCVERALAYGAPTATVWAHPTAEPCRVAKC
jgi:hypothetical protein